MKLKFTKMQGLGNDFVVLDGINQAAEIVGLSKRAFLEVLGKYGVSVFSNSIDDLHSEIENA